MCFVFRFYHYCSCLFTVSLFVDAALHVPSNTYRAIAGRDVVASVIAFDGCLNVVHCAVFLASVLMRYVDLICDDVS